ncbi:MAG: DEAD/DEAH box helicase [Candidatus Aenigmarchaeota archaeon]|nr:DEAD/DEAH box helicase [Candidatus Aenigmarchaeota archaeon]
MGDYKLLNSEAIEPREYQLKIAETASNRNTLVVLPTGMGKTLISVLVGINRLEKYPEGKILITSPTRPLNAQHKKSFERFTKINPEEIVLITGRIKPEEREKLYQKAKVVVATPQCIQNDLQNRRLNLENFSFITLDEAHRCVKDYAYTYIIKKFIEQSKHPLILGLTASPGGSYERIDEIRKNLFIEAVEIRTEFDKDVERYVMPIHREWVYVDFPEEFKKIKILLEERFKEDIFWLRDHHFLQTLRPSKKSLLMLQKRFDSMMEEAKDYSLFWAIMRVSEAIKIEYALELLETQGISSLHEYFKKIEASKKRTDKQLIKDPRIREAIRLVSDLQSKGVEHPKLKKVKNIIRDLVREKKDVKIIVFANYRSTVDKINELLRKEGIVSEVLIGQATRERVGLTQEKQIETLGRFARNEFNVLVTTSIGEEGLDIVATDVAIFYEAVPSEIRSIQRRGRVGRQTFGKVIFLITKDTRDEAYYWAAFHREKKMKGILYDLKEKELRKRKVKAKETLLDWLK